jgi:hypothetical protein
VIFNGHIFGQDCFTGFCEWCSAGCFLGACAVKTAARPSARHEKRRVRSPFFFLKTINYALKLAISPARMLHYVIVITYLGLIWPL